MDKLQELTAKHSTLTRLASPPLCPGMVSECSYLCYCRAPCCV